MGTIKFEIDLPEFEKELNINVTIRRDGEVTYSASSPSMGRNKSVEEEDKNLMSSREVDCSKSFDLVDETKKPKKSTTKSTKKEDTSSEKKVKIPNNGNLMGMDF